MVGVASRIGLVDFIDERMNTIVIDNWLGGFHWWEDEHDCYRWIGLSISLMWLWVLSSIIEFGLAISLASWCIVCYRWSWLVDVMGEGDVRILNCPPIPASMHCYVPMTTSIPKGEQQDLHHSNTSPLSLTHTHTSLQESLWRCKMRKPLQNK